MLPTHGFGSFCSSAQAEGDSTTIGAERKSNDALTQDVDTFVAQLLAGLDDIPAYYAHMGPVNAAGPAPVDLTPPRPADAEEIASRLAAGEWVVDLRGRVAFAEGHVAGSFNFEGEGKLATYLAWLIPWGKPVTLLADTAERIADAQRELARVGIDRPAAAASGDPPRGYGTGSGSPPSGAPVSPNSPMYATTWWSWMYDVTPSGRVVSSRVRCTFRSINCRAVSGSCRPAWSGCTARVGCVRRSPPRCSMPPGGRWWLSMTVSRPPPMRASPWGAADGPPRRCDARHAGSRRHGRPG